MKTTSVSLAAMVALAAGFAAGAGGPHWVYCKYCGHKAADVRSLTGNACQRHPNGPGQGRHALYEGSEKSEYTCKWCGKRAVDIGSLTSSKCMRHPDGPGAGRHEPAL
jgi:hypothetical protein